MEVYESLSIPFFKKNHTLKGILNSLREIEGISQPLGNLIHSLPGDEAMVMDIFLTKLLLTEEQFKERMNLYKLYY